MAALMNPAYILTLSCPDRTGIVHAVSGFLLERGGNIEEAAQYNDHGTGLFFMRVRFACDQSEAALRKQIATYTHLPGVYRSNSVRNVDDWYKAFGVSPSDKLYLDTPDRVRIW